MTVAAMDVSAAPADGVDEQLVRQLVRGRPEYARKGPRLFRWSLGEIDSLKVTGLPWP
jgi:hypothetical protein